MLFVALWTSGAPAMVYPIYAEQPGVTELTTTALFSTYPVALVATLIACGAMSDLVGRRRVLFTSLAVIVAGTSIFVATEWVPALFVARALQGMGVGIGMSAASAALVEFTTDNNTRLASSVNTASTASGTAASLLISGALVQYAPLPTRLPFAVLLGAAVVLLILVWFLPETRQVRTDSWRPVAIRLPVQNRRAFSVGVASITAAFMTGAVILAVGAQIVKQLVGTSNVFLAALALAIWAVAILPASLVSKKLSSGKAVSIGGCLAAVSATGIVAAGQWDSLPIFLTASALSGASYGLMFYGGLGLVTASASGRERAGTLSTMYLSAYLAQGSTAVVIGWLARDSGLEHAIYLSMPVIAAVCLAAAGAAALLLRGRPEAH
ncbi:MFS family permease [Allocatelliglobosispora scoriae]|uniref:MFS family permease n=1 Tax=Allocatelliglobosispora scoriae TaxID=643052 RepID=A0A841BJZ4_9ACTN|nr:MFS transporter [Allocatelliglobosispora scoriae]MBB5867489.1 MFS family permease [Allocatelliglobosispora scoriae]